MLTLLETVNATLAVLGRNDLTAIVNNRDSTARMMLALANRSGRELAKMRNASNGSWESLIREHEVNHVANQGSYLLPSDFAEIINDTVWEKGEYWQARGPYSAQEWSKLRYSITGNGLLRQNWRIQDGEIKFYPVPAESGQVIVFEYISDAWVKLNDGTRRNQFTADDDKAVFDDNLMQMAIEWRYRQSRGLAFGSQLEEYEQSRDEQMARDGGLRIVRMGAYMDDIGTPVIPPRVSVI